MPNKIEKIINEAADALDLEPRSYSGRGMYGKKCLGIVCYNPISTVLDIVGVIAEENDIHDTFEAIEMLKCNSQDNMGRSMIVYFPNIPFLK